MQTSWSTKTKDSVDKLHRSSSSTPSFPCLRTLFGPRRYELLKYEVKDTRTLLFLQSGLPPARQAVFRVKAASTLGLKRAPTQSERTMGRQELVEDQAADFLSRERCRAAMTRLEGLQPEDWRATWAQTHLWSTRSPYPKDQAARLWHDGHQLKDCRAPSREHLDKAHVLYSLASAHDGFSSDGTTPAGEYSFPEYCSFASELPRRCCSYRCRSSHPS